MRVDLERAMAQEELRASQQPAPTCESCGAPADNFVVATKQRFCLECALVLPKGSLPAMTAREKDDHENTDAHL
jgi:hypothetical protein